MENSKFRVHIANDEVRVQSKANSTLKFTYHNQYEEIWKKSEGIAFCKDNLLTFVGPSMITIELFESEIPIEFFELRSKGHYIFCTSHRHIHFHLLGASQLVCDNPKINDYMTIEEIHKLFIEVERIKPLFYLCGLLL